MKGVLISSIKNAAQFPYSFIELRRCRYFGNMQLLVRANPCCVFFFQPALERNLPAANAASKTRSIQGQFRTASPERRVSRHKYGLPRHGL